MLVLVGQQRLQLLLESTKDNAGVIVGVFHLLGFFQSLHFPLDHC